MEFVVVGPSVFVFIRMVLRPQRKDGHVRSAAALPRDEAEDDKKDGFRRTCFNSLSRARVQSTPLDIRSQDLKTSGSDGLILVHTFSQPLSTPHQPLTEKAT